MRKIKIIVLSCLFTLISIPGFSQVGVVTTAPGSITLDPSSWLTAIDQLYSTYDMVSNTITQIENQYKQIEQAIQRAQSIDWSNISLGSDFDIRNDIRDANRKVNQLAEQTQKIRNTLTSKRINFGGESYSLADFCGYGKEDVNAETILRGYYNYISEGFSQVAENVANGLTEEQKMAIYKKYGLKPSSYITITQTAEQVYKVASSILSEATEEAVELKVTASVDKTNAILNGVYQTTDSNGNPTESSLLEGTLLLSQQTIEELQQLGLSISDLKQFMALKMIQEQRLQEVEKESDDKKEEAYDYFHSEVPSRFLR